MNYQRLFHHGFAYQAMYVWSRPFRIGGNSTRDSIAYPIQDYPGVRPGQLVRRSAGVPMLQPAAKDAIHRSGRPSAAAAGAESWADYKALDRFEDYKVEPYYASLFPPHHDQWHLDLPVGRGKWLSRPLQPFVDELVGGWQIAGIGQVESQGFAPGCKQLGTDQPAHTYKHSVPIVDCSSGAAQQMLQPIYVVQRIHFTEVFSRPGNGGTCYLVLILRDGSSDQLRTLRTPINNNPNIRPILAITTSR